MTFGPRSDRNWTLKLPEKMRRKALLVALSGKARDQEIVIIDALHLDEGKTREVVRIVENLRHHAALPALGKTGGKVLVITPEKDDVLKRASRNLPNVATLIAQNLNAYEAIRYKYVMMPKDVIPMLEKTFANMVKSKA